MTKRVKVAISGAAGQIGYALAFRIASGQMFGPNVQVDLHLLELEAALPALHGVIMELEDCAFPLLQSVLASSDVNTAMKDVNWALLVGAVPRGAGMERADLLGLNAGIFAKQGAAINQHAAADVRVLVVGNPCNTNALVAMNHAADIPNDRFYAMTMLDELRARAQLAKRAQVAVSAVKKMAIWGNHSATQYPDFYHAEIKGELATLVIADESWLQTEFVSQVQQRGAAIIKARGASSAASAANSIIASVNRLLFDTPTDDYYSMCRVSQGEYGVDEGLIFSFPCRTENGQSRVVTALEHGEFAQQKLEATVAELRHERDAVKALGLIA